MQYKTEFYTVKGNSRRGGYQWSGSARRITPPKLPRGFGRETFGIRFFGSRFRYAMIAGRTWGLRQKATRQEPHHRGLMQQPRPPFGAQSLLFLR